MRKNILLLSIIVLTLACKKDKTIIPFDQVTIKLIVSGPAYEGDFYQGYLPKTDLAIWIEDENHNYIKTLLIDTTIVRIAEHGAHTEHLPEWQKITGFTNDSLGQMPLDEKDIPLELDAVTSASLSLNNSGSIDTIQVIWDLTNAMNEEMENGEYYYCAEVANIIKYAANPEEVLINSDFTRGTINLDTYIIEPAEQTNNIIELSAR